MVLVVFACILLGTNRGAKKPDRISYLILCDLNMTSIPANPPGTADWSDMVRRSPRVREKIKPTNP